MNYRHIFHAGSFADVFKHIVLLAILEHLCSKEKPYCYLDTHAGIGRYSLKSIEAQKTKEYVTGIKKLINSATEKPKLIDQYLKIVANINEGRNLTFYPGSPLIAKSMLRPQDKMILTELHPADYKTLQQELGADKRIAVHQLDGYQGLNAFLPPTPRRGVVLIDPPYETTTEFDNIINGIQLALEKWAEGIYLIWYPVKNRPQINYFEHRLKRKIKHDLLVAELNLYPDDSPYAINGSGMIIVNPPWQLDRRLGDILPWLSQELDPTQRGGFRLCPLLRGT